MGSYESIFDARGGSYNAASRLCPQARARERELLIERLAPEPHHRICDAPAGGGYLTEGLGSIAMPGRLVCVDPSREFVSGVDAAFPRAMARLEMLPLASGSVDRVGSLAGLHHVERKSEFVGEAFRVLAPGGRIAIADVMTGTPPAAFLDDSVDRYTNTGHRGLFFRAGEAAELLEAQGFAGVSEKLEHYVWSFESTEQLVRYCKLLFGLVRADTGRVHRELERHLGLEVAAASAHLPWCLVFACGTKPHAAPA